VVQVLSNLNENFFDFFDFVVKKFCGSSLARGAGLVDYETLETCPKQENKNLHPCIRGFLEVPGGVILNRRL
jgi:hypothetical protein